MLKSVSKTQNEFLRHKTLPLKVSAEECYASSARVTYSGHPDEITLPCEEQHGWTFNVESFTETGEEVAS